MIYEQAIQLGRGLLKQAGIEASTLSEANFLDWSDQVKDVLLQLPKHKQRERVILDLAMTLRQLRDSFDQAVSRDPLLLYTPQHAVSDAFHRSQALVRFLRSGNRCSKTISAIYEVYCALTGYHPHRRMPLSPAQIFVVGLNFTQYATTVFEPKYIIGEAGNALSPVFPVGGKWFYNYDEKKHLLEIACRYCAEKGQAGSCPHPKSRLILFSDQAGAGVMAGGQYGMGHLDEEVAVEFYREGRERLKTVPYSRMIVSLTPLSGESFWTETTLTPVAERGDLIPGTDVPICEMFTIDQFSAGLTDHAQIRASMADMGEADIQARIYGIPATASEFAVFDFAALKAMEGEKLPGDLGVIVFDRSKLELAEKSDADILESLTGTDDPVPQFKKSGDGWLRIWKKPSRFGQYVIGADVAYGLTGGDRSVASVLRMIPSGLDLRFELVAQFAGWVDGSLYAEELYKLGLLYKPSTIVVERNGPGDAVIRRLKELGCWFLYRDVNQIVAAGGGDFASGFGVDTNIRTKSIVVSMLQSLILRNKLGKRALTIYCTDTLRELRAYVQKPTESGRTFRFEADGTEHDDRVMSLALGIYAAQTSALFDIELDREQRTKSIDRYAGLDDLSRKFWTRQHAEDEARRKLHREMEREYGDPSEGVGDEL